MFKSPFSIDSMQFHRVILRLYRSPRIALCLFLLCFETPRLAVLRLQLLPRRHERGRLKRYEFQVESDAAKSIYVSQWILTGVQELAVF